MTFSDILRCLNDTELFRFMILIVTCGSYFKIVLSQFNFLRQLNIFISQVFVDVILLVFININIQVLVEMSLGVYRYNSSSLLYERS